MRVLQFFLPRQNSTCELSDVGKIIECRGSECEKTGPHQHLPEKLSLYKQMHIIINAYYDVVVVVCGGGNGGHGRGRGRGRGRVGVGVGVGVADRSGGGGGGDGVGDVSIGDGGGGGVMCSVLSFYPMTLLF